MYRRHMHRVLKEVIVMMVDKKTTDAGREINNGVLINVSERLARISHAYFGCGEVFE